MKSYHTLGISALSCSNLLKVSPQEKTPLLTLNLHVKAKAEKGICFHRLL